MSAEIEEKPHMIGYARVSTEEQNLDLQIDALKRVGVKEADIITEKVSGAKSKRPKLDQAIKRLRPGDVFVVWRMDRVARSLMDLIKRLNGIEAGGAKFKSLSETIDTQTATGRLVLHVLGAISEFERQLTIERTIAGVKAARARGVKFGPPAIMTIEKVAKAQAMRDAGDRPSDIAERFGVHLTTIYNYTVPAGMNKKPSRVPTE